jgi:hypothetical protein
MALLKNEVIPNVEQAMIPQVNVEIRFLPPKIIDIMLVTLPTSDTAVMM